VSHRRAELRSLAALFLTLGTVAFGGPAAHVALMEAEVVGKRGWFTRAAFLELVAASNLLPGPGSTELAIFIGQRRAGWAGLVLAGACFILPASLIVLAIAMLQERYGALPAVVRAFAGVEPVVLAVVVHAIAGMARTSLRDAPLVLLAVGAAAGSLAGVVPLPLLALAGAAALALHAARSGRPAPGAALLPALAPAAAAAGAAAKPVGLGALFGVFLKVGAVLFGSGYVLLAFLRADLVQHRHWLDERQLLEAVAVGQVTPGPVFTTATYIGYRLAGLPGALVATAGIFLPSFVLVAIAGPLLPRFQRSPAARAFLGGVVAASLGLMAAVCVPLARAALGDAVSIGLFAASVALLLRTRVNPAWLVAGGALVGVLRAFAR